METQTNQLFHEEICASGVVIDRICKDVHQEINALCPLADRQHARASFLMTGVLVFFISLPIAATYLYLTGGLPFSIQLTEGLQCSIPLTTHAAAPEESSSESIASVASSESTVSSESSLSSDFSASSKSSISEISSASSISSVLSSQHPDNHVGVYLTAGSAGRDDFLKSTLNDSAKVGATAIVFDVKSNNVLFDTNADMARQLGLVRKSFTLKNMLHIAKERGFYTIARFVSISDSGFTAAKPETQLQDPHSGQVITPGYIDPANAEALKYNAEIICDLAQNGVSEINLDYIRFSTSDTVATSVYSPTQKTDRVEVFLRMARDTIDRCGPQTKLGISTFAILGWAYAKNVATLGQDVVRFAPLVDIISPMAYPAMFSQDAYYNPDHAKHSRMYTLVYQTLIGYQALIGPAQSQKLRPWLQGYGISRTNARDQIQATMDSGGCGFTFWNADNDYYTVYAAMKDWEMPARCL